MKAEDSIYKHFLNEHQVAQAVGMSVASVRRWRFQNTGPRYVKIGASVRYDPVEVERWIRSLPSGGGKPLHA